MDTPLFRGIWRTITFNVILTITNAICKNLPSNSTKWRPIIVYIYFTPEVVDRDAWIMNNSIEIAKNTTQLTLSRK